MFKMDSFKGYLLHLSIIIIVTVGAFIYFFNYYLPDFTRHGQELVVPDLKGKTVKEVEIILKQADLRYQINDSAFVKGEIPEKVLRQHPLEGTKVKANRKIYLTITSRKPTNVPMPDLVNKTYKAANLLLTQVGLEIGDTTIVQDPFPVILKQTIKGKPISPGTLVPKYSKIDLMIGDGEHPDAINIEDTTF